MAIQEQQPFESVENEVFEQPASGIEIRAAGGGAAW